MNKESIIGDLKKYAGGDWTANTQKVTLNELPAVQVVPVARGRPRKDKAAPATTAEEIAAMVKPPMTVLHTGGILSPDSTTLKLCCARGHVHSVYIKDVLSSDGVIACKTCNYGSKFTTMVRESLESILKIPFVIADTATRGNPQTCEFVNDEHLIAAECRRGNSTGVQPEIVGDKLLLTISFSTSLKKIRASLLEMLKQQKDWFSDEIRAAVEDASAHEDGGARKAVKMTAKFNKGPMPYTRETADAAIAIRKTNPILARMQMNIVACDDDLCIENAMNKIE